MRSISGNVFGSLFLFVWAAAVFKTWALGDMEKLINPKFIPVTIASAVIALFMAISVLLLKKYFPLRLPVLKIIFLVIPLMTALSFRPSLFAAMPDSGKTPGTQVSSSEPDSAVPEFVHKARADKSITLDDINYFSILSDMFNNPGIYTGKSIHITGMIVRKANTKDTSDCAIVRMMMVCCAADLMAVGVTCRYDKASAIPQKSWHTIEGKIGTMEYEKGTIPFINIETLSAAPKPDQEYIYPF